MQRIFRAAALLLAIVLALFPAVPAAAAAASTPPSFSDVPADHPDRPYIEYLAAHGLISGYPDGRFGPDDPLTRAAATKIAVQVAGMAPLKSGAVEFTDVPATHWALPYVRAGVGAKLVNGFDDKTFQPDASLTRAQLAALAIRATRQPTNVVPDLGIADLRPTDWYYPSAVLAVAAGMMTTTNGNFRPNDVATRAEAARAFAQARVYTPSAFSTPLTAMVDPKTGTVEIQSPNETTWTTITEKTELPVGSRVRTAGASTANILFPDASAILLDPVTEVVLTKSRGTELVTGPGVEELQIDLIKGRIFTSVTPRITNQELTAYGGYLARFTDKEADARAAAAMAPRVRAAAEATGENLPDGATRLQIWADPASLEPGDTTGADITVVLVDDSGEPVTADKGDVPIQVLSDVGTVSNSNPVIPKGYNAVTIKLTPPAKEPADAKTRVTAVAGDLSTALIIPTATVHWWEQLFTKKVRAQVRMPYSVASVRGTFASFVADPEVGDQVTVAAGTVTVTSVTGDSTDVSTNQTSSTNGPNSAPTPPSTPPPSEQQQISQRLNEARGLYDQAMDTAPPETQGSVQAEKALLDQLLGTVQTDQVPPTISISGIGGDETGAAVLRVSGSASDNVSLKSVSVSGGSVTMESSSPTAVSYSASVQLKPGSNTITATATDGSGNTASSSITVTFNPAAPSISLSGPKTTKEKTAQVSGSVKAPGGVKSVTVNGQAVDGTSGSFTATIPLQPGRNTITATVTDEAGKSASDEITIISASVPPTISLSGGETKVGKKVYPVTGSVQTLYADLQSVTVNGTPVNVSKDGNFAAAISLKPGPNTITATATDVVGNTASATVTVTLDAALPTISISSPSDNLYTKNPQLSVSGSLTAPAGVASVSVNGSSVAVPEGATSFTTSITLKEGANTVTATVTDLAEKTASASKTVYLVTQPPTVVISSPSAGQKVATKKVTVSGSAAASQGPLRSVTVNGAVASVGTDGSFSTSLTLKPGSNTITATATDAAGNTSSSSVTVDYKADKAIINLSSPPEGQVVKTGSVTVSGSIDNGQDITSISIGGTSASVSASGSFSASVPLLPGKNTITVSLPSEYEAASATRSVIFADRPPTLSLGSPADGTTVAKPDLTVSGNAMTSYGAPAIVNVNGQVVPVGDDGSFSTTIKPKPGDNTVTVTASDPAGNSTALSRKVKYKPEAPLVTISSPSGGLVTKEKKVTVSGSAFSLAGLKSVTINGSSAQFSDTGRFSGSVDLKPGKNTITVVATDILDANSSATVTVTLAGGPPTVSIGSPSSGFVSGKETVTVSGSAKAAVDGMKIKSVQVNGAAAAVSPDGSWVTQVTLREGDNTLVATATDELDNSASSNSVTVKYAKGAPTLSLGSPGDDLVVRTAEITVSGSATASTEKFSVTVNGSNVSVNKNGNFSAKVKLQPGKNTITATVTDDVGRSASLSRTVTYQAEELKVSISSPTNGAVVTTETVSVSGSVSGADDKDVTVTINGGQRQTTKGGFSGSVNLVKGANTISVSASDAQGRSASDSVAITFAPTAPQISMDVAVSGNQATVSGNASSQYGDLVVSVGTKRFNLGKGGSFSTTVTLQSGANTITATATDKYGSASASRTQNYTPPAANVPVTITTPATNPAWSSTSTVTVGGKANPGASLSLKVDDTVVATATADATGTYSFSPNLAEGSHLLRVTDIAPGGTYAQLTLHVDKTAPTLQSPMAYNAGAVVYVAGSYTEANLKDVKVEVLSGGNAVVATGTAEAAGGYYVASLTVNAPGTYQARVTVTDLAGNQTSQTVAVNTIPVAFGHLTPAGQTGSEVRANVTLENVPAGLSAGTFELILPAGVTFVKVETGAGTLLSGALTVVKTNPVGDGRTYVQISVARGSAATVAASGTLATITVNMNGQTTSLGSIEFNETADIPGGLLLLDGSGAIIPAMAQ